MVIIVVESSPLVDLVLCFLRSFLRIVLEDLFVFDVFSFLISPDSSVHTFFSSCFVVVVFVFIMDMDGLLMRRKIKIKTKDWEEERSKEEGKKDGGKK